MQQPLRGARAVRVFLCFAAGYLLSYGLRAINAVIAPALTAELGLSNADLGLLSSAYFVAFGSMQLPLGIWLDRYGPRRTEAALLLFAAAGAAVFASSSTLAGLWLGRALIGVGVSSCLMAAFKAYRMWFAIEQQGTLASMMLMAGTAGALASTLPVTLAMPLIGWRGVFWVVCALLLMVSGILFFALRDVERAHVAALPAASGMHADGSYRQVFSSAYFWRMGIVALTIHGTFVALQTLWAGPWMTTVLGRSQHDTGQILFILNFVLMLAYLVIGWSTPRLLARTGWHVDRVIALGLGGMLLAQLAILLSSTSWSWSWWLLLAMCVPVTTLVQSHVGLAFPAALAGRANSAYNLMLFIGAFCAQWGIGMLIDVLHARGMTTTAAMRAALGIFMVIQLAALVQFLLPRIRPSQAG